MQLDYRIRAMLPALAVMTVFSQIKFVYPVHELIQLVFIVEDEASLEITFVGVFGPHSGTRQIGGAHKGPNTVNDDGFRVYSGAQNALEQIAVDQGLETVEVLAKARSGLLGVNEAYRYPRFHQIVEHFQQRLKPVVVLDMQILDVCGHDPQEPLCLGQVRLDEFCVDVSIEQEPVHGVSVAWPQKTADEEYTTVIGQINNGKLSMRAAFVALPTFFKAQFAIADVGLESVKSPSGVFTTQTVFSE